MNAKTDNPSKFGILSPMGSAMNLKSQLRFYLDRMEMSATQLAKKASVPKQSLCGWLAGSNPRDVRQIKRVADVLGITLDHLIFGNGPVPDSERFLGSSFLKNDNWTEGLFEVKFRRKT